MTCSGQRAWQKQGGQQWDETGAGKQGALSAFTRLSRSSSSTLVLRVAWRCFASSSPVGGACLPRLRCCRPLADAAAVVEEPPPAAAAAAALSSRSRRTSCIASAASLQREEIPEDGMAGVSEHGAAAADLLASAATATAADSSSLRCASAADP